MKTDFYTKAVLTVIALCLTIMIIKDSSIISKAHANPIDNTNKLYKNYGLVLLNEDGSINVHLKSSDLIDVNIKEVGGWNTWGKLPVVIKENEDK